MAKKTTMAKSVFAFFDSLFDVTVALIAIPQFIYFMSTHSWAWEAYKDKPIERLPAYVCLAVLLFSSYSFIRLTVSFNRPLRERFWQEQDVNSLKGRLAFLTDQTEFWIKAGVIAVIYLLLPLKCTLKPLAVVTNAATEKQKILCLAVLLPVLLVLAVLAHLSAYKRWARNNNPKYYTEKRHRIETISAAAAYVSGASAFIVMFPVVGPILLLVFNLLTVWHVVAFVVLLCVPFAIGLARAVLKRRSFLKRLNEVCAEKGYTISEIRYPYLSLFLYSGCESFTLTIGDKSYACKLVPARRRNIPIVLSANGELTFVYTISMRRAVINQRTKTYNIGFKSENPKILVINPVPKTVYELYAGKPREIDNGAVVGDYKLFAATGFLHAAELNVLDR